MGKRRRSFIVMTIVLILNHTLAFAGEGATKKAAIPDWVRAGKPIRASQVPREDYPYLARWLDEHSKPAKQYLIDLFKRHQVIIVGEFHHIKEHKDIIIELIPRLYHEAGVRSVAWEFSRHTDNERLKKLVTAPEYDRKAALEFARDQLAHDWNSKEHWDIIEAVWRLNKSLEPNKPGMQMIGLDKDVDMPQFLIILKTKPADSPEFQAMLAEALQRDKVMAQQVEKNIIEKGMKGLVFVGRGHDFTHYQFPPDINMGRDIMGNLLHKKCGDRVFQVWLGGGLFPIIEKVVKRRGPEPIGFDLHRSPFANLRYPKYQEWRGATLSDIARGYIYLGPGANLHKNTPIKGFVTQEMLRRYKR